MKKEKLTPAQARRNKIWKLADQSDRLREGELELDISAKISEGDDNGAYIQTWMWVSFDGTKFDKSGEPRGPKDWSPIKIPRPSDLQIWKLARQSSLLRDGELELDTNAKISRDEDENGAYIQTWMWVPFDGTPLDKEDKEA